LVSCLNRCVCTYLANEPKIEIPDSLPEGRRSSFKKGIADGLIEAATTRSDFEHTPDGHEIYREQGKVVGRALETIIQNTYPK
jgi:hypothetical protein